MEEHEHTAPRKTETKPAHDEVAKKAYAIYEKEGRPQGHAEQYWSGEAEGKVESKQEVEPEPKPAAKRLPSG